jgi:hypothetical protein
LALAEKSIQENLEDYRLTIEREKQGLISTNVPVKKSEDAKTSIVTLRFFCLPLGHDPRPKDPLTWTLWRHETTWGDDNRAPYESWQPEESYLTGWRCMQERDSRQKIYIPYNEESKKAAKGKRRTSTYFSCVPSTVNPWGKEG